MKLVLKRVQFSKNATFGKLFLNGVCVCDTLEPKDRAIEETGIKIKGETAIPLGTYALRFWDSPKFGYRCLKLANVPFFSDILIHSGNYARHTQGCILVGKRHDDMLINSRETLEHLIMLIKGDHDKENHITITR